MAPEKEDSSATPPADSSDKEVFSSVFGTVRSGQSICNMMNFQVTAAVEAVEAVTVSAGATFTYAQLKSPGENLDLSPPNSTQRNIMLRKRNSQMKSCTEQPHMITQS